MENMNADFIEIKGQSILFKTPNDLIDFFGKKEFTKYDRKTNGLSDDKGERYSLKIYLKVLAKYNLIRFPITVTKAESPDFIITEGDAIFGVEITQNIPTDLGRDHSIMTKNPGDFIIEMSPSGHRLISANSDYSAEICCGDQDLEKNANLVVLATRRKLDKLNKTHFANLPQIDLLIFDEYHHVIQKKNHNRFAEILNLSLKAKIETLHLPKEFNRISFIMAGKLFYNCANKFMVLPMAV
jgi:hypothetical protein